MRPNLLSIVFIVLSFFSLSIHAKTITKENLPEKVFSYISKNHPKAQDMNIREVEHFGQPLYELKLTATKYDTNNKIYKEPLILFFRLNGDFYTNGIIVEHNSFKMISDAATKSLQQHYPNYEILAINTIVNPNGVGEEYDINLLASGKTWHLLINDHGKIMSEMMKANDE